MCIQMVFIISHSKSETQKLAAFRKFIPWPTHTALQLWRNDVTRHHNRHVTSNICSNAQLYVYIHNPLIFFLHYKAGIKRRKLQLLPVNTSIPIELSTIICVWRYDPTRRMFKSKIRHLLFYIGNTYISKSKPNSKHQSYRILSSTA